MAKFYEVTLTGRLVSQLIINRLTFVNRFDGGDLQGTAIDLCIKLGAEAADVLPSNGTLIREFLDAQTTSYELAGIMVRNILDDTDFFELLTEPGTYLGTIAIAAGDRVPTFVASKLRTNRVNLGIRRGTLALTGGTEEQIEGSDVWNTAYVTLLDGVAGELNEFREQNPSPTVTAYNTMVVRKEPYTVPGSSPARTAYRYWTTAEDFEANIAENVLWSAVAQVTTQTSRKIGRGA